MTTTCARFAPYLSAAEGEIEASTAEAVAGHVSTCAACRAEAARFVAIRRTLGEFAQRDPEPTADLVPAILARTSGHKARRALPMVPVPPVELARALQDNREAILTAGAAAAVVAGAAWVAWKGLRSILRTAPQRA